MKRTPPSHLEQLLAHAGWVRHLAAHLVEGPHDAADVVQEVWQAALARRSEPIQAPRAWLAAAVRNLVNLRRRGEGRRRRRERDHGERRPVEAPSAAELVAEQDLRRDLIERVDRLPEGERDVVLLRFWQDLPPREVAIRLGIPVNTVRSRTARALERLRAELDERHGDRRAWCLALVPLLDAKVLRAAGIGVGAGAGVKVGIAAAAALALFAGGYAIYANLTTWSPPDLSSSAPASEVLARFDVAADTVGAPQREAGIAANAAGAGVGAGAGEVGPGRAIRGRVVDLEGRPIAGAFVHRGRNDWFVAWQNYGKIVAADWSTTTDANGEFTLPSTTFVQQNASGGIDIGEVTHPDYVAELEWSECAPDQQPTLRMRRAFTAELDVEVVERGTGLPVPTFHVAVGSKWGRSSSPDPKVRIVPDPQLRYVMTGRGDDELAPDANGRARRRIRLVEGARNLLAVGMAGIETIEEELAVPEAHGTVVRRRYEVDFDASADVPGNIVLHGIVVDAVTGAPVVGASLRLDDGAPGRDPQSFRELAATTSRTDGSFRLGYAPAQQPGKLVVAHRDYEVCAFDASPGDAPRTLRAIPLARLEVQFVSRGTPQAGLHVLLHCRATGPGSDQRRAVSDAEGKVAFDHLPPETVSLFVTPTAMDPDERAIDSLKVHLAPGERCVVQHEFEPPDRVLVNGTVVTDREVAFPIVPTFVPLDGEHGWIAAKALGGQGYLAGGVRRGRYLVLLTPSTDDHRDGPFAFAGVVDVKGPVSQVFDLELPRGTVVGRITGLPERDGRDALRVVAVPVLPKRSLAADQLLGSARLATMLGASVDDRGLFQLRRVADGPCELQLRRGAEVLARRRADVRGGLLDVGTWDVAAGR